MYIQQLEVKFCLTKKNQLYKKRNYVKINLYLRIGDDIMALSKFKKMLVDEDYDEKTSFKATKTAVLGALRDNSILSTKFILIN